MTQDEKKKRMRTLQEEYNKVHDRMDHMENPANIAAANRTLDRIVAQMNKLMD